VHDGHAPQPAAAAATYTFRVRILGRYYALPGARRIWRELELTADQTLGELSDALPLAFGFDDPHLWSFWGAGRRRRLHRRRGRGLERYAIVPPGGQADFKHLPKNCRGP
jgi:hypothetical protein